jgi:cytochrome c oxidase assembly protein subunit 15
MTSSNNPWLHRFALLTALATLALIALGGLVTSHGVGMAVPDWPNTYGYNMFLFPVSQWVGGILYEHTHRLAAALVGLLTTILALWLWVRETQRRARWSGVAAIVLVLLLMGVRQLPVYVALAALAPVGIALSFYQIREHPGALRWWGIMAFAAVVLQGVLGGLRVVLFKDQIGIFHATLAQLFFVLTCAIALLTGRWWQDSAPEQLGSKPPSDLAADRNVRAPTPLLFGTTLLILCQLVLGATMRHQHAGLAIPDFPLAYGKIWPAIDSASVIQYNQHRMEVTALNPITGFQVGLQMAHRLVALLILAAVGFCASALWRKLGPADRLTRLGLVWFGLIFVQALLGAATIWTNKAADIATGHVIVGALSLATGAILSITSFRATVLSRGAEAGRGVPCAALALNPAR